MADKHIGKKEYNARRSKLDGDDNDCGYMSVSDLSEVGTQEGKVRLHRYVCLKRATSGSLEKA